jgi:hypothetical protein
MRIEENIKKAKGLILANLNLLDKYYQFEALNSERSVQDVEEILKDERKCKLCGGQIKTKKISLSLGKQIYSINVVVYCEKCKRETLLSITLKNNLNIEEDLYIFENFDKYIDTRRVYREEEEEYRDEDYEERVTFNVNKIVDFNKVRHCFAYNEGEGWFLTNRDEFEKIILQELENKVSKQLKEDKETLQSLFKQLKELEKQEEKLIEQAQEKAKELYIQLLSSQQTLKLTQGCDLGKFYLCDGEVKEKTYEQIQNEFKELAKYYDIKEIVKNIIIKFSESIEKNINKLIDGLIFEKLIPDYYVPIDTKYDVDELVKQNKAEIIADERRYKFLLIKDKGIIEEMLNINLK